MCVCVCVCGVCVSSQSSFVRGSHGFVGCTCTCTCVCAARATERVCRFEKQVPACRVPRGRLDSKPTRCQDHGNEGVSPSFHSLSVPAPCPPLSVRSFSPPSVCALAVSSLRYWRASSLGPCVKRRSTGALTLSTNRQSIRRQARTFAREIAIFTILLSTTSFPPHPSQHPPTPPRQTTLFSSRLLLP